MIVCLVGLPGSGKSVAVHSFEEFSFTKVRLGDITDEVLKEEGLELNEENEQKVRLKLREDFGPSAYAIKNIYKIKTLSEQGNDVVVDGVRTYDEFLAIKKEFEDAILVAIHASQPTRIKRLSNRNIRPLTEEEVKQRDKSELEKSGMAITLMNVDYTIVNEGDFNELKARVQELLTELDAFLKEEDEE